MFGCRLIQLTRGMPSSAAAALNCEPLVLITRLRVADTTAVTYELIISSIRRSLNVSFIASAAALVRPCFIAVKRKTSACKMLAMSHCYEDVNARW